MRTIAVSLRRLRQSPVFTLFSIVTLALGIGVTTAVYSAVYALFARPTQIDDPGRAVLLTRSSSMYPRAANEVTWADYRELAERQRSFTSVASFDTFQSALASRSASTLVRVEAVTGGYFGVLGVRTAPGRPIQPADDRPDAPLVMVLGEPTWRAQFNADPAVVGTTVRMANQTIEIVGVAPAGFRGTSSPFVGGVAAWVPIATANRLEPRLALDRRGGIYVTVIARLKSDATIEAAGVDVATLGAQLDDSTPLPGIKQTPASDPIPVRRAWTATSLDAAMNSVGSSEVMRMFLVLPALVLLVACTNLANLVLSRGVSRQQEFAVRTALGASRARLVREELVETGTIALAGGALGLVATSALLQWAVAQLREPLAALAPEVMLSFGIEPAVVGAAGFAVVLTLVVAGLVPALQLTRPNPGRTLAADSGGAVIRWRGRSNLIALQVGVSVGLFLLTVISVRFIVQPPSRGFVATADMPGLAIANVPFEAQQYDEGRARRAIETVLDDLRRSPEVRMAAATTDFPAAMPGLRGSSAYRRVVLPGQSCTVVKGVTVDDSAEAIGVTPAFFEAMSLPLRHGRAFEDRDSAGAESVIVLNESLAQRVFGQPNAVGRAAMLCPEQQYGRTSRPAQSAIVVGIVADGMLSRTGKPLPRIYAPLALHYGPVVTFLARDRAGDARAAATRLATAIRRADPELAARVTGAADVLAQGPFVFLGFVATVAGGLATLALVLAMAGLYGVLSHVVDKRRREMGVRVALGASPARIVKLVLKDGLRPVAEGTFIGLGAALVIRQLMQLNFTESFSPIDVATFLLAAVPLTVAGAIAAYLPARRAARVSPNVALKDL
jgi:predicted permease